MGVSSKFKVNGLSLSISPGKSPAKNTLDKFIPRPTNYEGTNHPFKTVLERNAEIEHTKLKERLLNSYATSSMNSEADSESFGDSLVSETDSDNYSVAQPEDAAQAQDYIMQVRRHKRGRPSKAEVAALNALATAAAAKNRSSQRNGKQKVNTMIQTSIRNGQAAVKPRVQAKNVLDKRQLDGMSKREVPFTQLRSSVNTYFGAANRLATGETFVVQAKRITPDGKVQYLVEWEGGIIG